MAQQTHGALTWAFLALRFLVELVLFASPIVIGVRVLGGAPGVVAGVAASAVVAVLWGVLLSPRRRIDAPLGVRVLVEALLFLVVASGLAWCGLAPLAVALVVVEVVVVAWLWWRGLPPGADAGEAG